jgi:hypothetical protein
MFMCDLLSHLVSVLFFASPACDFPLFLCELLAINPREHIRPDSSSLSTGYAKKYPPRDNHTGGVVITGTPTDTCPAQRNSVCTNE